MKDFWDSRYAEPEFAYGTEPNEFFKSKIKKLEPGNLLLLGEGEGRNAIFAARLGWNVTAVDYSEYAKAKAEKLAATADININYVVRNLSDYLPPKNYFDAVGLIYLHLPQDLRETVHAGCVESLKAGGRIILECFDKEQIKYNSGGPKNIDMLYSLEDVFTDFQNLEIELFEKATINLTEGKYHNGPAEVIRFAGVKE